MQSPFTQEFIGEHNAAATQDLEADYNALARGPRATWHRYHRHQGEGRSLRGGGPELGSRNRRHSFRALPRYSRTPQHF